MYGQTRGRILDTRRPSELCVGEEGLRHIGICSREVGKLMESETAAEQLVSWARERLEASPNNWSAWVAPLGSKSAYVATFDLANAPSISVVVSDAGDLTLLLGRAGEEMFSHVPLLDFFEGTLLPTLEACLAGEVTESQQRATSKTDLTLTFHGAAPARLKQQYRSRGLL